MTITDIKEANKKAGKYFFSPDTMRFFRSRVASEVYTTLWSDYAYFVTSEINPSNKQAYSVRRFNKKTGDVVTEGKFFEYSTKRAAIEAAKTAARREERE